MTTIARIAQVKKHYDRLTDAERFALIVAASERGDKAERDELVAASPRKSWSVVSHYGYSIAFDFVSMYYLLDQLGWLASLYFMKDKDTVDFDVYGAKVIRRILANYSAWVRLCRDYKIDETALIRDLPHFDTMITLVAMYESAADIMGEGAQPAEEDITATYDDMRAVVEKLVKDWK